MHFQPRFLFVALIAVFVSPSVRGQQPTVTLRPSNAVSDPNTPSVRVIADQQRVPLGTLVNFSLSPSSIANDRQYVVTLYFGDGRQQVMNQAATTHFYRAVGTYTYSVAVKRAAANPPQVDLSASPLPAQTGQAVRFIAQTSGPYPNLQYRFDYGDGRQSTWQTSAAADHTYTLPGNYSAYVDIGNGTQRIGGSVRKQIPVTSTARSVSLNATPLLAQAKRPVIFTAKVSPNIVNATYKFTFGDGEPPVFQTSPQVQHIYRTSGSYRAVVQVSQTGGPASSAVQSGPVVLNVQPASTTGPGTSLTPTTRATPTPPSSATPTPVSSATPTPSSSATPTPTPSPVESPSRDSSLTSSSGSTTPNTAGPSNSTSPSGPSADIRNQSNGAVTSIKWWYWLFAGVLLLLLFKATGYLFAAKPTFTAFSDPGVAAVGNQKGLLPLDFQLLLNPNVSAGDYAVTSETPLVTNTERLENRQVLEL
jgi:PKD domain-containing protein